MLATVFPINSMIDLQLSEIEFSPVRAQGAGGQHVNKVSTAIHLRFDIHKSSLPEHFKDNLLALNDQRLTNDGVIVIKSQSTRSQEANKLEAINKLVQLILDCNKPKKIRRATKPTKGSITRRLESKNTRKQVKQTRKKVHIRHD